MPVESVLQLLDDLVFKKTHEHLKPIYKTILQGTLEGQTYSDIAKESHLSEGHIGDEGSELWNLLSEVLGVEIRKKTAQGEDVYATYSQTDVGRYLIVFFIYKPQFSAALPISARDMTESERRYYETQTAR